MQHRPERQDKVPDCFCAWAGESPALTLQLIWRVYQWGFHAMTEIWYPQFASASATCSNVLILTRRSAGARHAIACHLHGELSRALK